MADLHKRAASLVVADRKIVGLDFEFRVERSLKISQNTAEVTVYNLSSDTRKHLQDLAAKAKGVAVELHAGFVVPLQNSTEAALGAIGLSGSDSELPLLFLGQLRYMNVSREGPDGVLHMTSGDGDGNRKRPIDFSFGPGTTLSEAIQHAIKELGAGIGTATKALLSGGSAFGALSQQFTHGTALSGNAQDEMTRLVKSAGKEVSIQNGDVQILDAGKPLNTLAVDLGPDTGLVGSPEIGEKGTIKFRAVLNPEIYPGRQVRVRSTQVDAFFRCEKVTYLGQTRGGDWYADGEGTPVSGG